MSTAKPASATCRFGTRVRVGVSFVDLWCGKAAGHGGWHLDTVNEYEWNDYAEPTATNAPSPSSNNAGE